MTTQMDPDDCLASLVFLKTSPMSSLTPRYSLSMILFYLELKIDPLHIIMALCSLWNGTLIVFLEIHVKKGFAMTQEPRVKMELVTTSLD